MVAFHIRISDMSVKRELMRELRSMASPSSLKGMAHYGIDSSNALGISIRDLRRMASKLDKDPSLAEEPWNEGLREARILATMIAPVDIGKGTIERWVAYLRDWDSCDQLCMNLLRHRPSALDLSREWADREDEFGRRAAFALLASAAVSLKGEERDDEFIAMLELVARAADDPRPLVRKSLLWALTSIARRGPRCLQEVEAACMAMAAEGGPRGRLGRQAQNRIAQRRRRYSAIP